MANVFLALGSNIGNCKANLNLAIEQIKERIGRVTSISAFCVTEPWGYESKNWFLNAVLLVDTQFSPQEILNITQNIELELGRTSKTGTTYNDRLIDIDILFYDKFCLKSPQLTIPHPELHLRSFVLNPLMEIAPDFIHPLFEKSIRNLHQAMVEKERNNKNI
jgi:2-amino-4-hydroxy-6-hydroxymethyldihydropteridine diphosphokinase